MLNRRMARKAASDHLTTTRGFTTGVTTRDYITAPPKNIGRTGLQETQRSIGSAQGTGKQVGPCGAAWGGGVGWEGKVRWDGIARGVVGRSGPWCGLVNPHLCLCAAALQGELKGGWELRRRTAWQGRGVKAHSWASEENGEKARQPSLSRTHFFRDDSVPERYVTWLVAVLDGCPRVMPRTFSIDRLQLADMPRTFCPSLARAIARVAALKCGQLPAIEDILLCPPSLSPTAPRRCADWYALPAGARHRWWGRRSCG